MTEIDNNTGLPKLPKGQFWRIEKNRIFVMKKSTLRQRIKGYRAPKELHEEEYGYWESYWGPHKYCLEADPVTPENVVERCQAILEKLAKKVEEEVLYGDYPPKKLGADSNG